LYQKNGPRRRRRLMSSEESEMGAGKGETRKEAGRMEELGKGWRQRIWMQGVRWVDWWVPVLNLAFLVSVVWFGMFLVRPKSSLSDTPKDNSKSRASTTDAPTCSKAEEQQTKAQPQHQNYSRPFNERNGWNGARSAPERADLGSVTGYLSTLG